MEQPDNGGGHPWTVGDGTRSTLLLFNNSSKAQPFDVKIGPEATGWHRIYTLKPLETKAISINELISLRVKDDAGHVLPSDISSGEVSWFVPDHYKGTGRLLQSGRDPFLARNFSCGYNIVLCGTSLENSYAGLVMGFTGFLGGAQALFCLSYAPSACSGCSYGSGGGVTYSWSTTNPSVSPITGSNSQPTAYFDGQSVGSSNGNVVVFTSTCNFGGGGSTGVTSYTSSQHTYPNNPLGSTPCRVSTCFDCINPGTGQKHHAQDVTGENSGVSVGTPIYAADSGTVSAIQTGIAQDPLSKVNFPGTHTPECAGKHDSADYVQITTGVGSSAIVTKYYHVKPLPGLYDDEAITAGQEIGTVVLSGCSSGPHTHIQATIGGVLVNFTLPCDNSHFDGGSYWYDDGP